jgi:hypothetical protein
MEFVGVYDEVPCRAVCEDVSLEMLDIFLTAGLLKLKIARYL